MLENNRSGPVAAVSASGRAPKVLRCADVHGVRCDTEWTAPTVRELVAAAMDHGMAEHGFTAVYYNGPRMTAIRHAVIDS